MPASALTQNIVDHFDLCTLGSFFVGRIEDHIRRGIDVDKVIAHGFDAGNVLRHHHENRLEVQKVPATPGVDKELCQTTISTHLPIPTARGTHRQEQRWPLGADLESPETQIRLSVIVETGPT